MFVRIRNTRYARVPFFVCTALVGIGLVGGVCAETDVTWNDGQPQTIAESVTYDSLVVTAAECVATGTLIWVK